ncbi:MAG: RNA-binding cell elongation regulator Jag/EloR [Thermodesulfobacteriota bacterium]
MKDNEFEGKTTEEAVQNASRELGIPEEDLDFEILEPGSAGIFGLVGGKKARIRVHQKASEAGDMMEAIDAEEEETTDLVEEKDITLAEETLRRILELIPVEATVHAEQSDGKIVLNIAGDRSGILIGRKGQTLDAIQFIVNKIVGKALDKKISVVVDSENYRRRRQESLTEMALKMGDKAKKIKKPVTTSPLNPQERRIIHLALKEDERLDTKSRGEGLMKRVVIIPKR